MAAGLGFKDFVTGEVLTAADVDGYLMQGVWVFASAAARDAAVTSPQEGNFAYLKDTNVTTYYTGSAWANLDTTGMTNPMTTTGDTIYSSSGSTPARLGIGTAGQVLQVNSGATAPEWATPAGTSSGLTLIRNTSFSSVSSVSLAANTFSSTYTNYKVIVDITSFSATGTFGARLRAGSTDAATNYQNTRLFGTAGGAVTADSPAATSYSLGSVDSNTNYTAELTLFKPNVAIKKWMLADYFAYNGSWDRAIVGARLDDATQFDSITFLNSSGNITGRVYVYGYSI